MKQGLWEKVNGTDMSLYSTCSRSRFKHTASKMNCSPDLGREVGLGCTGSSGSQHTPNAHQCSHLQNALNWWILFYIQFQTISNMMVDFSQHKSLFKTYYVTYRKEKPSLRL